MNFWYENEFFQRISETFFYHRAKKDLQKNMNPWKSSKHRYLNHKVFLASAPSCLLSMEQGDAVALC